MKLVIGIGNPGRKYEGARHNVGFLVVDALAEKIIDYQWSMVNKYNSLIIDHQPLAIFCKPQTFMNSSGIAVSKLVNFYKIKFDDIWVIHDDLDIALGEYKIQKGVGPKLHYGIKSIDEELGTEQYWRVRVGVENRKKMEDGRWKIENFAKGEEYILQNFTLKEHSKLNDVTSKIVEELIKIIT